MITPQDIEQSRKKMAFWLKRWYDNPLAYVIECVGDVPTHQQAQILKAFEHHDFVAVRSGHGIGKSKLNGWLINWWLDTRGKKAPITGAGGDQLRDVLWPEVICCCKQKMKWISRQYENTTEELRQKGNKEIAKAVLRTVRIDNDDALQGFHDCMFFIDEGSGVRDGVFEVASGAMGDPGAHGFMCGNPTRTDGYMYNVFHSKTFWFTLSFASSDSLAEKEYSYTYVDPMGKIVVIHTHGRQTQAWVDNMRESYGLNSNAYKIRVLGEFATLGRDLVIEEKYLSKIVCTGEVNATLKKGVRRMGIDPAWTGDDDTAIVIREGTEILHIESWHGFDTVESFQKAKMLFDEWDCDYVHIDTIGVGAGIYDNFCHEIWAKKGVVGYPAIKVAVSEASPVDNEAKCAKLRDYLWWKSRKLFRTKQVVYRGKIDDVEFAKLKKELRTPTYKIQDGKIKIESKEELRKRGVKSPNIADSFNLTLFGDNEILKTNYAKIQEIQEKFGKKKKKTAISWKSR